MKVILDAYRMQEREEAHRYLKEMLNFPDYYGNNLDALFDCLTDLNDVELMFENADQAKGYFQKVYTVCLQAAEENPAFRVIQD